MRKRYSPLHFMLLFVVLGAAWAWADPAALAQIAAAPGHYRLYLGRSYVTLFAAQSSH